MMLMSLAPHAQPPPPPPPSHPPPHPPPPPQAYLRYGVLLIGVRVPVGHKPAAKGAAPSGSDAGGGASAAGVDDDNDRFRVLLYPHDLVLTPGMYLHAISFDGASVRRTGVGRRRRG